MSIAIEKALSAMLSADHAAVITPSDTADLTVIPRALYIGGAGTVNVVMVGGETVDWPVPAGTQLNIRVRRVLASGTDATDIRALW